MELTIADIKELIAGTPGHSTSHDLLDPAPGDKLIIRTVTMTLTGRAVATSATWIVLDQAAWIADSGRWTTAIETGKLSEVEPMGDGVRVARAAVVDVTPWKHELPMVQK